MVTAESEKQPMMVTLKPIEILLVEDKLGDIRLTEKALKEAT